MSYGETAIDDREEAKDHIKATEQERLSLTLGRDKDYQRMIQAERCVIYIKTYSYGTYLDYQKPLMENIKSHVSKSNS